MKIGRTLICLLLCGALGGLTACSGKTPDGGTDNGDGGTDTPPVQSEQVIVSSNHNYAYGRVVEAEDGTLVATGEQLSGYDSGIPIYRSTDKGATWTKNAKYVHDNEYANAAYDARWQPSLLVLPRAVGPMDKGDILLVATSIDGSATTFNKTGLNLYISKDVGLTWTWLSEIHSSRRTSTENGCWEGNLYVNGDGELVCMFADETDHGNHSQRIAMKTTSDGTNWSDLIEVVALNEGSLRPGMPAVTQIKDGKYFLTIEMVGENGVPIYWKSSDDGVDWGDITDKGSKIEVNDKIIDLVSNREIDTVAFPGSSPYCAWSPKGKNENGTLYVTAQRTQYTIGSPANRAQNNLFVSYDLGETWLKKDHPITYTEYNDMRPAYSNSLTVSRDGNSLYVVNTVLAQENNKNNLLVFTSVAL